MPTGLFDVYADPLEKLDLSEQLPEVVNSMVAALAKLSDRPGCSWDEQVLIKRLAPRRINTHRMHVGITVPGFALAD